MRRTLTLLSALALLQTGEVMAKPKHIQIPASSLPAGVNADILNRKLQQMDFLKAGGSGTASKQTATERMSGESYYDYTMTPGSQLTDSFAYIYSNGRGTAFDYQALEYDVYNSHNYPSPFSFGSSYVDFDTVRSFVPPGSSTSSVINVRTYNSANKVLRSADANFIDFFSYDASNRLTKIVGIQNNSGAWDSSYRDFYSYNASGYLVKDSVEGWNSATVAWEPQYNIMYTVDGSGRPTTANIVVPLGGGITLTVLRATISYSGSTANPTVVLVQSLNSTTFMLENTQKDTIGYASGTIVSHDSYGWDTTAAVWTLAEQERRRLNGASLPDSAFYRSWNLGKAIDSSYSKLGYNSQNNPTYRRDYIFSNPNPRFETRWYYGNAEAAGVGNLKAMPLDFYPNPTSDKIQLRGLTQGKYVIYNTAGQLMQSGKVQSGGAIPVQSLSPGMYTLNVQDANGQPYSATFIRQ